MQMTFFRLTGWAGWDVTAEPAIADRMPVLVDDDLLFEDAGAARPSVAVNRWLRELPVSGAPSPATWATYARVLRDWMSLASALSRRLWVLGWATLFPVVMFCAFMYCGMCPWTWIVVAAALAVALPNDHEHRMSKIRV